MWWRPKIGLGEGSGRTKFDSNIGDDHIVKVDAPTEELDEFMKRRIQPDIIVMDVDGAEGSILDAGKKTFGAAKYILFENNLGDVIPETGGGPWIQGGPGL